MQVKLAVVMPRLQVWLKKQGSEGLERIERRLVLVIVPVAVSYLTASIIGGLLAQYMVSNIVASRARITVRAEDVPRAALEHPVMANSRDIQKIIKERNIFNSEGKFPEEKFGSMAASKSAHFDIDAPCVPTTLAIELLGTIYVGDRMRSLATVKDKTYSEPDIYRVGDVIYGNEQATVAAVERQKLIINNNGAKECIDLDKSTPGTGSDGFPTTSGDGFGGVPTGAAGTGSEITLEAAYVEGELGPGFGKIVDAARLVPNTADGTSTINGFKIFAIKGGSLFARVGFQNGDIITRVNDTSMTQAEQGFALYQAFQDEKEVRIQLLRGGVTPLNITVRIK
jgi:general secretion pathway protein C